MKFFKKQSVAFVVMVLAIAASTGIGYAKAYASGLTGGMATALDTSLDTAYYEQFIFDEAGVLSSSTEQSLAAYNANWDYRYNSLVAFIAVDSVNGDAEDYAYDMAEDYNLGGGDALLLIVTSTDEHQFVWGDDFDTIMNTKAVSQLNACMDNGDWEKCVTSFYSTLNDIYLANFDVGNAALEDGQGAPQAPQVPHAPQAPSLVQRVRSDVGLIVGVVLFLIVLAVILSAIDRSRYNAYRQRYYGVSTPPYVFRPIFFWHGPRSSWYRRNWRQPPPPPPPGGPRGPGGPGPGGFGGTPPRGPSGGASRPNSGNAGGFGGVGSRGPRGTGFGSGGGSFGGTRGSSSRTGGSFGGSSRSGGSFGGGRSDGSRGGGFGGRR